MASLDLGRLAIVDSRLANDRDALWTMSDDELVALAGQELERTGLARSDEVEDGCVFRVPKAYPVYDSGYSCYLEAVKEFVAGFENLPFPTVAIFISAPWLTRKQATERGASAGRLQRE